MTIASGSAHNARVGADVCRPSLAQAERTAKLVLSLLWIALTIALAANHALWRDEVRAYSFAIHGADLATMFATVRGDGHPLLWYLLLRGGNLVVGPLALPLLAWGIGAASAMLIIWRAPDTLWVRMALVFGYAVAWEGTVMARNYGISMLLMLIFVVAYRHWRDRGIWLIVPLMLLANSNVHSLIIAWMLFALWWADRLHLIGQMSRIERAALWHFGNSTCLLMLASLACFLTVFPTFNDLAVYRAHHDAGSAIAAVLLPGTGFLIKAALGLLVQLPLTALVVLILLRFTGHWLTLLAALATTSLLSLMFTLVYPASERHIALWFIFLVCLLWLAPQLRQSGARLVDPRIARAGRWGWAALLFGQCGLMVATVGQQALLPHSQSREAADIIRADPALRRAIVLSDPDTLNEALPWYLPDIEIWRLREQAFGPLSHYTRHARLHLSLDTILADAERLARNYDRPVVIILDKPPSLSASELRRHSYGGVLTTELTSAMAKRFAARTTLLAQMPPAMTDESFAIYRLNPR